jgi:RNA polymerase sigma-B factor
MTRTPSSTRTSPPSGRALRRRNQLVQDHQQLVRPIAHHYARCSPEGGDDLTQVGLMGLIRAAELYRRNHGTPFEAFARPHIRGAILHYLRDLAPSVRLPRRQAEQLERLVRLERRGEGRQAAERLGINEEQRSLLLQQRRLCRAVPLEGILLESVCGEPQETPTDPTAVAGIATADVTVNVPSPLSTELPPQACSGFSEIGCAGLAPLPKFV